MRQRGTSRENVTRRSPLLTHRVSAKKQRKIEPRARSPISRKSSQAAELTGRAFGRACVNQVRRLLRRSDHRGLNGGLNRAALHVAGIDGAAAASAIAAVATAMMPAVAAVATVAAVMTAVTTGMAAVMTAVAAIASATAAAASEKEAGRSLVLTADEGDANQGEKDRHTENNNAIHPQSSSYLQVPVSGNTKVAVITKPHLAARRPKHGDAAEPCESLRPRTGELPVVKFCRLRGL